MSGISYVGSGIFTVAAQASGASVIATIYSGTLTANSFASGVLAIEIPYGILKVDQSGITGEALCSPVNALRKLNARWDTQSFSGYLTTYKEDALSVAYKQPLTSLSGAPPITDVG